MCTKGHTTRGHVELDEIRSCSLDGFMSGLEDSGQAAGWPELNPAFL